jgi:hypothetical protein
MPGSRRFATQPDNAVSHLNRDPRQQWRGGWIPLQDTDDIRLQIGVSAYYRSRGHLLNRCVKMQGLFVRQKWQRGFCAVHRTHPRWRDQNPLPGQRQQLVVRIRRSGNGCEHIRAHMEQNTNPYAGRALAPPPCRHSLRGSARADRHAARTRLTALRLVHVHGHEWSGIWLGEAVPRRQGAARCRLRPSSIAR